MTDSNNLLSYITIEPTKSPATHTIFCLHGLGADSRDFENIAQELQLPESLRVRFLLPNAPIIPVSLNNGYKMRAWYDIYSIAHDAPIDEKGILQSVKQIEALITKEEEKGIPSQNILLAGFSQGAALALTACLRHPKLLGGAIGLSGYLPFANALAKNHIPLPIFIGHGTNDPIVPMILGKHAADALTQAGHPVTWRTYAMPHTLSIEEIQDIKAWISALWT